MLARRLLIALTILIALTALTAGLAPRQSPVDQGGQAAPSPSGEATSEPVEATLDAQSEGQRVEARVGQLVQIVVRSAQVDSVAIAELGTETAEPDSPARFELLADTPGSYAIETLENGRKIGVLDIAG